MNFLLQSETNDSRERAKTQRKNSATLVSTKTCVWENHCLTPKGSITRQINQLVRLIPPTPSFLFLLTAGKFTRTELTRQWHTDFTCVCIHTHPHLLFELWSCGAAAVRVKRVTVRKAQVVCLWLRLFPELAFHYASCTMHPDRICRKNASCNVRL